MKREIAKGAAWMVLLRLCDRMIGLASTLVLARLLVPADFGLIAMAMSFIALIELAGAFSFEIALIQHNNPGREHYDTAWTLNLAFALACAALTAAMAPQAARFYAEPRLTVVMWILAVGWALQGFENIGIVNFRRNMNFSREFQFMLGKRVIAFVVTLVLAFTLRSYWALIAGQLTARVAGVGLSYLLEAYRPRLSLAARVDLFSFSGWLLVTNVMGFGLSRLPHFVLGRVEGPSALGLYTLASEFARLPSTELSAPINRAVLPGLARLQSDSANLRRVFVEVLGMTFALTLPASIGLALLAGLLVDTVLGARWVSAGPILAVLAVSGAIEVLASNNGVAYMVLGKTRLAAAMSAIKLAALVLLALMLVPRHGVMGMALAEMGASMFIVLVSSTVLMRAMALPMRQLLGATWRTIVASAVMGACLFHLFGSPLTPATSPNSPLTLLLAIAVGVTTYLVALFALWWLVGSPAGAEATAVARARSLLVIALPRWFEAR